MDDSEPNEVGTDMGGCDVPDVSLLNRYRKTKNPVQETTGDATGDATGGATGGATSGASSGDPHSDDVYSLSYPNLGVALIIANSKFKAMQERIGAQVDTSRIYQTVKKLGLEPRIFENLTSEEVRDEIVKISKEDHSDKAMFVCVITSHGDRRGIYGTDDIGINLKRLVGHLKGDKCPSLAGKPKIFFIQACRGCDADPGVEVEKMDGGSDKVKKMICTIPTSADFLMSYSTVEDYFAFLNPKKGSYYIRALADELEKCDGQKEIAIVLQRVARTLAFTFTSNTDDPSQNKKKQCPCYTSTLTKQLYLDASKKK